MSVSIFYTITDGDDVSTFSIPFPGTFNLANAANVALAFGNVIKPMLNGGLKSAGISFEVDLSATWGPTPQLIADVQEQAQFVFRTVGGFAKLLNLPTFIETFFINAGSGKQVDITAPEVVAFLNAMEDGLTVAATLYQPSDFREADIVSTESAVQHWGRNRR